MWNSSGIGRYLKETVPFIVAKNPNIQFALFGDASVLALTFKQDNVSITDFQQPIYSIFGSFKFKQLIPKKTTLLWWPLYNAPLNCNTTIISTIFDCYHLDLKYEKLTWIKLIYAKFWFANTLKKSNKILTISAFSKSEIKKHFPHAAEKIVVTRLGCDGLRHTTANPKKIFSRPYVLSLGNIKPHKNLQGLIEAFSHIKKMHEHDLIIIGRVKGLIGSDASRIKAHVASDDRITLIEEANDDQVKGLIKNADLVVSSSFYEGFSLTPIEAIHENTMVAVSDIPAHRETLTDLDCFFDPNNPEKIALKISSMLSMKTNNPRQWRKLLHLQSQTIKNLTWAACAKKTNEEIMSLYSKSGINQ